MNLLKHLNTYVALMLAVVVVVVLVARKQKDDKKQTAAHEPMSAVRLQTSDDAGLQAMPADLNGA